MGSVAGLGFAGVSAIGAGTTSILGSTNGSSTSGALIEADCAEASTVSCAYAVWGGKALDCVKQEKPESTRSEARTMFFVFNGCLRLSGLLKYLF